MLRELLAFLLLPFLNERGEAGSPDDSNGDDSGDDGTGDDPKPPDVDKDPELIIGDDDDSGDDSGDSDDPGDDPGDDDPSKPDEKDQLIAELEGTLKNKEAEYSRNFYGLRQEMKKLKEGTPSESDDDAEFTDSQLMGLMETHKDDPATMLQIMRHEAKQAAKNQGKETVQDLATGNLKKETDAFLLDKYPNFYADDSEIRPIINQAKERFGLNDHPLGDFYAAGACALHSLPEIIKSAREEGKKEALGGKAEDKRIVDIGKKTPADPGRRSPKSSTSVSGTALETAKQMGFDKNPTLMKHYAKMLGNKKSNTVSVEA